MRLTAKGTLCFYTPSTVSFSSCPLKSYPHLLSSLKHFPSTFRLSVPQIFRIVYSSILNVVVGFSEALGRLYKATQCHIHQDSTLYIHCYVSPIFCTISNRVSCRSILKSSPSSFRVYSPNNKCGPRVKLIIHLHLIF